MDNKVVSFEICQPSKAHAQLILQWRNDAHTLAMFYHSQAKSSAEFWQEYQQEYFCFPQFPAVFIIYQNQRVGFLRFQPTTHPQQLAGICVDISINIAPEFRGQGLGRAALQYCQTFLQQQCQVDSILAEVKIENHSSLQAFKQAGFRELDIIEKSIADLPQTFTVKRLLCELTPIFWRHPSVFVIAEAGSNWRMGNEKRDLAMAKTLIDVAVDGGADAVKFQVYRPETVYAPNAGKSHYLKDAGIEEDIENIFQDLAMPYAFIPELANYCQQQKIEFMSTPFSLEDFQQINPYVNIHKIASYELAHVDLLAACAQSQKPCVMSTGAANIQDIAWAVDFFRAHQGKDLCLLQCTAKYPAPMHSMNLRTIPWLQRHFATASGLSDHSRDPIYAPLAAVALGARVIEKHYTLDNRLPGPDHSFALTASELKQMVQAIRHLEQSLGSGVKNISDSEQELAQFARRGLQVIQPIQQNDVLQKDVNYAILRPGNNPLGIHPKYHAQIEGKLACRNLMMGEGLQFGDWQEE
jgi:sialic acid synthase SpsE/RimJ/RimL family protein N-acetyltransferase